MRLLLFQSACRDCFDWSFGCGGTELSSSENTSLPSSGSGAPFDQPLTRIQESSSDGKAGIVLPQLCPVTHSNIYHCLGAMYPEYESSIKPLHCLSFKTLKRVQASSKTDPDSLTVPSPLSRRALRLWESACDWNALLGGRG